MSNHKFNAVFLATAVALFSQSVFANPESFTHKNGSTVVNINKADGNGLSHNIWASLNVSNKGMVLNNSMENILRENGNIGKNSNLDSAAKIILNEVVSNKSSTLGGFIEVAGQKADVIIANPNGITCSGCSFINTGRTTLTTGAPLFKGDTLTGFNVTKGTITVKGNGLQTTDFTEILSQKINIQGMVKAAQLKAVAGTYKYDLASRTAAANLKTLNRTGIDVSALGGVTAGVIQLQTTDVGSGVNNSGILTASALYINSNGQLTNTGKINGSAVNASVVGKINTSGSIQANEVSLTSNDSVINSGALEANKSISLLSVNKITNEEAGSINAGGDVQLISLAGDIENKGAIKTAGSLYGQSGYANVEGKVAAVANTSIINAGSIDVAKDLSLVAVKEIALKSQKDKASDFKQVVVGGDAALNAEKVYSEGAFIAKNISAQTSEIENKGDMAALETMTLSGKKRITNNGSLSARTLSLASEGEIKNYTCSWLVLCSSGTVTADKMTVTAPKMTKLSNIGGEMWVSVIEFNKPAEPQPAPQPESQPAPQPEPETTA